MYFEAYLRIINHAPENTEELYGCWVEEGVWIAIDREGSPSILFSARADQKQRDIVFQLVSVQFSRQCKLILGDGEEKVGCFSLVTLEERDPDIVRAFLRLLEESFGGTQGGIRNEEIAKRILDLAGIFKALNEQRGDLIGLWGELFVILSSANIANAVSCWCYSKNAKFDFVSENFLLEVKTTLSPQRKHRFSYEQLRSRYAVDAYVASIALIEIPRGRIVGQLIDEISNILEDAKLRELFFHQCLMKGGKLIYQDELRLAPISKDDCVNLFDATTLPVPQVSTQDPIDNIRFDLDFSQIPDLVMEISISDLEFLNTTQ